VGILEKIFGTAGKAILDGVGSVVDRFISTPDEKKEFLLATEAIISERMKEAEISARTEINAKKDVMVAELQQEDRYVKRARPTIVYSGLVLALFDFGAKAIAFFSGVEGTIPSFVDPAFWYVWGGVCGVYVIGRSAQFMGANNKATKLAAGPAPPSLGL
jgi:hypothetical protein